MLPYERCLRLGAILPFGDRVLSCVGSRVALAFSRTTSLVTWSMILFYMINARKSPTTEAMCELIMAIGTNTRHYLLVWKRLQLARSLKECREIRFSWHAEDGATFWSGYRIIFAVQVLMVNNQSLIASSVDSVGALLVTIAAYFRPLQQQILRITDNYDESVNVVSEFVACCRLHQRILNFSTRIDGLTSILVIPQLLCSCYNLSLISAKLIGSDPDRHKYLQLMVVNLGELFVCQWAAEHLIDGVSDKLTRARSLAMATAAYSTSWSWTKGRMGKLVVLVIARSRRPVQMTAAGLFELSLENFHSMLTSAASIFALLRDFDA